MISCSFKKLSGLKDFLKDRKFPNAKFCVDPDYVNAIIGLSDDGKFVYDFHKMSKYWQKQGLNENDANEYIYYNCDMPYFEIVSTGDDYWFDELFENKISKYKKYFIGANMNGVLLIDSSKVNENIINEIETIFKESNIKYKVV